MLTVIPNHVCTCVNMHDEMTTLRKGQAVGTWKIAARGKNAASRPVRVRSAFAGNYRARRRRDAYTRPAPAGKARRRSSLSPRRGPGMKSLVDHFFQITRGACRFPYRYRTASPIGRRRSCISADSAVENPADFHQRGVRFLPLLLFNRLADGGKGFDVVAGIKPRRVDLVLEPGAAGKALGTGQLAFAFDERLVHLLERSAGQRRRSVGLAFSSAFW